MTALLELEGVTRTYGVEVLVHALRDVSLTIAAGDFVSIVGPSGSGKSTMLGLLGCLDLPSEGVIRVGGVDVTTLDDANRSKLRGQSIGFVFQQFHLIPHLTALGNVETALLYRDIRPSVRRDRAMNSCHTLAGYEPPVTLMPPTLRIGIRPSGAPIQTAVTSCGV